MIVKVLQTGMNLAAVMLLLPRMVRILMEGLIPISESAREFVQRRAIGHEVNIGLDSAILIGHPAAISRTLILVPIAILLSVILPGNRVILFADLAVIPFMVAMAAPVTNGNIFRIVIIGTITLAIGFYVGMALSPLFTGAATAAGFKLPENAAQITSICDGFAWVPWLAVSLGQSLGWLGLLIVAALTAVGIALYRMYPDALEGLASEHEELKAAE